jgi:hypothetical protein
MEKTSNTSLPQWSNFLQALTSAVTSVGGIIPEGACFGSVSCQENREQLTQAQLLSAQAQLVQAQANAAHAQKPALSPMYLVGGVLALIAVVVTIVLLTRKK